MWNPTDNWQPASSYVEPVTPPATEPGASPLVCLQVNKTWIPYVVGSLMQLVQPTTWDTSDPDVRQTAIDRATLLMNMVATALECETVQFRFTEDCLLQYSVDGGETWIDVPGWDTFAADCFTGPPGETGPEGPEGPEGPAGISITSPPTVPGQSTADRACGIAAYVAGQIVQGALAGAVAAYDATSSDVDAILSMLDIFAFVDLAVVPVTLALDGLYHFVTGGNRDDLEAASTDATLLADLTCAIYTAILSDGEITSGNAGAVAANIAAIGYSPSDVQDAIDAYVADLGAAGLMTGQQLGPFALGDCSACSAFCFEWNLPTDGMGAWAFDDPPGTAGHYVSGTGIVADVQVGTWEININISFSARVIDVIEGTVLQAGGGYTTTPAAGTRVRLLSGGAGGTEVYNFQFALAGSGSPQNWVAPVGGITGDYIHIRFRTQDTSAAAIVMTDLTIHGHGDNPFGTDNCT